LTDEESERLGLDEGLDEETKQEANRIWYEFWLNAHSVSYAALGYHTGDGITLWARKIDEHAICQIWFDEAIEERHAQLQGQFRAGS
jgi:hypothetical protein